MNPSQALKQKIEMDAVNYQTDAKPSTRKYSSLHYIQEDYCAGAQSLVPLVESLAEALEYCHRCEKVNEALTNYRKFIGG